MTLQSCKVRSYGLLYSHKAAEAVVTYPLPTQAWITWHIQLEPYSRLKRLQQQRLEQSRPGSL